MSCYLEMGDACSARELADAVLAQDSSPLTAWQLGEAYLRAERDEEAADLFRKAYEARPGALETLGLAMVSRRLGAEEGRVSDLASRALRMTCSEADRYDQVDTLLATAASLVANPKRRKRCFGLEGYEVVVSLQDSVVPGIARVHMYLAATDRDEARSMVRRIAAALGIPADRIGEGVEWLRHVGPILTLLEPSVGTVRLPAQGEPLPI